MGRTVKLVAIEWSEAPAGQADRHDDAAVRDELHGLASRARLPDGCDNVDHWSAVGHGSPGSRQRQQVTLGRDHGLKVAFFDRVLCADLARRKLAFTNPSADGLGVPPRSAGGLRHGQHCGCILQHGHRAGRDWRMSRARADDEAWARATWLSIRNHPRGH